VAAIFPRRSTAAWRRAGRRLVARTACTDGQSIPRPPPARLQARQGEPPGCDRDVHARRWPPARLTCRRRLQNLLQLGIGQPASASCRRYRGLLLGGLYTSGLRSSLALSSERRLEVVPSLLRLEIGLPSEIGVRALGIGRARAGALDAGPLPEFAAQFVPEVAMQLAPWLAARTLGNQNSRGCPNRAAGRCMWSPTSRRTA